MRCYQTRPAKFVIWNFFVGFLQKIKDSFLSLKEVSASALCSRTKVSFCIKSTVVLDFVMNFMDNCIVKLFVKHCLVIIDGGESFKKSCLYFTDRYCLFWTQAYNYGFFGFLLYRCWERSRLNWHGLQTLAIGLAFLRA